MERFFKKIRTVNSSDGEPSSNVSPNIEHMHAREEVNLYDLPADPGLRKNIYEYDTNDRERIRRAYLQKGPCQPKSHVFPWRQFGSDDKRRFRASWFNEHSNWLEYSIAKDEAYCLSCYLFKPEHGYQAGGDSFVNEGFTNWKNK